MTNGKRKRRIQFFTNIQCNVMEDKGSGSVSRYWPRITGNHQHGFTEAIHIEDVAEENSINEKSEWNYVKLPRVGIV